MSYRAATCPHCGADLKLDTNFEKGYCTHCGSMIDFTEAVKVVKPTGPIEFAGYESLPTLLRMIDKDLKHGTNQTPEFKSRLIRAMELSPDDEYLYGLVHSQIWEAEIEGTTLVEYNGTAEKVVVPKGIETIAGMAFARHHQLKDIVLPKSLKQIMPNAFIYESKLTIHAYKDTYGAQYCMSSPAKLNLLDFRDSDDKYLRDIEDLLRKFNIFKRTTEDKIVQRFNYVYSTKWALVFLALLPAILIIYSGFSETLSSHNILSNAIDASPIYSGIMFLSGVYILFTIMIVIIKSGYNEIKRKAATKMQTNLFNKKCNDILKPLGIIDFKYHRNILDGEYVDLQSEAAKLKNSHQKIVNMDWSIIYKKPYINYSFMDYLRGEKPSEYYY